MNYAPRTFLIVIGVLVLIKSIWGLVHPSSIRRVARWWSKAALQVNTLCGTACIIVALALWVSVLLNQSWTNRLVAMFGAVFIWAGFIYMKPHDLQKLIKRFCADRSLIVLRVISAATAVGGLILIRVAYKGL